MQKFKNDYLRVRGPVNQTGQAIGAELQGASKQTNAQLEASFRELASRFQSQVSQLETLKPPASLAADWNSVIGASQRVESDLTAVIAAAATNSRSAGEQAGASLVTDASALKSAAATIKSKLGIQIACTAPQRVWESGRPGDWLAADHPATRISARLPG